jgi:aromatic-L-amino-acid decarboxylase
MVLRAFGRSGIEARIREHCLLARLLASRVEREREFELAAPVTMSVVCFRFVPDRVSESDRDALNEAIVERVNASGAAYLTHSRLAGRTVMRVGLGNVLTTEAHLIGVWELVVAESRRLGEEHGG